MTINRWKHKDGNEYINYQLVKSILQDDYNDFIALLKKSTDLNLKVELFALGSYTHGLLKKLENIKNSS